VGASSGFEVVPGEVGRPVPAPVAVVRQARRPGQRRRGENASGAARCWAGHAIQVRWNVDPRVSEG